MLLGSLTLRTHLDVSPDPARLVPALLDHYQAALEHFGAAVERVDGDELRFTVAVARPARLRFWEADLGFIARGTLALEPSPAGCTVELHAQQRTWFLLVALMPWVLLIWALGWTSAPWRYALAYGGIPLFMILWVLVWANLAAFLDDTNRAFTATRSAGKA